MNQYNFYLSTLGCHKNLVDSEHLIARLESNGFRFTENINEASICIINTCGFIKPSIKESLQLILEAVNLKTKKKINSLIISGCMTQRFYDEVKNQFPEVDFITGVDSAEEILRFLKKNGELKENLIGERKLLTPTHYAYLKISEGCNRECSFCAIPLIRGKIKSKPIEELIAEAKFLASQGVRELIIISQDTSSYGVDLYGKPKLAELLSKLADIEEFRWIRVMYLYPMGFPDDALEVIAKRDNLCKYVDIPLQHISDKVLKLMRRGSTRKNILALLDKIKSKIPKVTIRTTFIVGFPNEAQEDFNELEEFISSQEFDRFGVFEYSREYGTSAFELEDPIPPKEKKFRYEQLMLKQKKISYKKNLSLVGKVLSVIIDDFDGKKFIGRTERDAPEVDNIVIFNSDRKNSINIGDFAQVKIEKASAYELYGKLV